MMEFALSTLKCHNSTLKFPAKEAGSPLKLHLLINKCHYGSTFKDYAFSTWLIITIPKKTSRTSRVRPLSKKELAHFTRLQCLALQGDTSRRYKVSWTNKN